MVKSRREIFRNEIIFVVAKILSFVSSVLTIYLFHNETNFLTFLKFETLPVLLGSISYGFYLRFKMWAISPIFLVSMIVLYSSSGEVFYLAMFSYLVAESITQSLMYQHARSTNLLLNFWVTLINFITLMITYIFNLPFAHFLSVVAISSTLLSTYYMKSTVSYEFKNASRGAITFARQVYTLLFRMMFLNSSISVVFLYLIKFMNVIVVYAMSFSKSNSEFQDVLGFKRIRMIFLLSISLSASLIFEVLVESNLISIAIYAWCILLSLYLETFNERT